MSEVTLVDYLGSDLTVANAARVSFGKRKENFDNGDSKLLNYLAKHKHWSPFRHIIIQFHIKCPEFVARQLYKHIVGIAITSDSHTIDHAWNEISGRYVKIPDIYIPPEATWRSKSQQTKQGSGEIIDNKQLQLKADVIYKETIDKCISCYKFLLHSGIAPEQARMILPVSFITEFYWTASFQAIMNVIALRTASDAQKEIRDLANQIKNIVGERFPASFEAFKNLN